MIVHFEGATKRERDIVEPFSVDMPMPPETGSALTYDISVFYTGKPEYQLIHTLPTASGLMGTFEAHVQLSAVKP